jgi:hypothetical protein
MSLFRLWDFRLRVSATLQVGRSVGPSIRTAMIASRLLGTQLFAMNRVELFFVTVTVIGFALMGAAILWM